MPKEIIKHNRFHDEPGPDGGTWVGTPIQVEVGWLKGLPSAQVGVVRVPAGDGVAPSAGHEGVFCDLDRDGINRLIRSLRKARDAAFGADA